MAAALAHRCPRAVVSASSRPSVNAPALRRHVVARHRQRSMQVYAVDAKSAVEPKLAVKVSDADFEAEVLQSTVPVLVDFWAPWCGPCRMLAPIVDEVAKQFQGKLKVVSVNTDTSPEIATKYSVRSIPTVMIFKEGQKQENIIGAVAKATLVGTVEKYVG